jgi:hypothetical protein
VDELEDELEKEFETRANKYLRFIGNGKEYSGIDELWNLLVASISGGEDQPDFALMDAFFERSTLDSFEF